MNEQKSIKFCVLNQRVLGAVSAYFWLLWQRQGQTIIIAFDGRGLSLVKHVYKKKKACIKERKKQHRNTNWNIRNSNQISTYLFIELLLLPRPCKHLIQFLQMSLFLLTNTDVNTVHWLSPAISPKWKFSPNRSANTALS